MIQEGEGSEVKHCHGSSAYHCCQLLIRDNGKTFLPSHFWTSWQFQKFRLHVHSKHHNQIWNLSTLWHSKPSYMYIENVKDLINLFWQSDWSMKTNSTNFWSWAHQLLLSTTSPKPGVSTTVSSSLTPPSWIFTVDARTWSNIATARWNIHSNAAS